MLWLNGGPGASSLCAGLLFENGPCSISSDCNTTIHNPYSWNEKVNIIYLDQPIGTGFSYASDGSSVSTLADLSTDVYAFLQVFLQRFPQYAANPFHIAAESWGGHYAPYIGSHIFRRNKESQNRPFPGQIYVKFASIMLGNGLTDPASQFETIPGYMCGDAPYPPYGHDSVRCRTLRSTNPSCIQAIRGCYRYPQSKTVCDAATAYCWSGQFLLALKGVVPLKAILGYIKRARY